MISLPLVSFNTQRSPFAEGWYDKPFSMLASASAHLFYGFASSVQETTRLYLDLINIKHKNALLKMENTELKTRLLQLQETLQENTRLRSLLEFKTSTRMDLVAAQVISHDLLSDHNTLQINKGEAHGLKEGMAVITLDGVLGYIFRPQQNTSYVMLITDRYAVVDGLVARSRARGIIEGRGGSACTLNYVEKSEDVQAGDLIVSSGLDNIFPKGLPVARVSRVENLAYAVSLKVDLEPVVDPDKVEEVFVITNAQNNDLTDRFISSAENEAE